MEIDGKYKVTLSFSVDVDLQRVARPFVLHVDNSTVEMIRNRVIGALQGAEAIADRVSTDKAWCLRHAAESVCLQVSGRMGNAKTGQIKVPVSTQVSIIRKAPEDFEREIEE